MSKRTAALVPFGDEDMAKEFVKDLCKKMGYRARTVHVTEAMIDDYNGGNGPDDEIHPPRRSPRRRSSDEMN